MGKTAFVLSAVRNAAVDFGKPVAFFSLEMSSVQLVNRLISGEAELPQDKLRRGNLASYEWEQLHAKIGKLVEAPRSEEHTSELQSLMRITYAVFCLKKKKYQNKDKTLEHIILTTNA